MTFEVYNKMRADQYSANVEKIKPVLSALVEEGYSLSQMCKLLNSNGYTTATGKDWNVPALHKVLNKLNLKTVYSKFFEGVHA